MPTAVDYPTIGGAGGGSGHRRQNCITGRASNFVNDQRELHLDVAADFCRHSDRYGCRQTAATNCCPHGPRTIAPVRGTRGGEESTYVWSECVQGHCGDTGDGGAGTRRWRMPIDGGQPQLTCSDHRLRQQNPSGRRRDCVHAAWKSARFSPELRRSLQESARVGCRRFAEAPPPRYDDSSSCCDADISGTSTEDSFAASSYGSPAAGAAAGCSDTSNLSIFGSSDIPSEVSSFNSQAYRTTVDRRPHLRGDLSSSSSHLLPVRLKPVGSGALSKANHRPDAYVEPYSERWNLPYDLSGPRCAAAAAVLNKSNSSSVNLSNLHLDCADDDDDEVGSDAISTLNFQWTSPAAGNFFETRNVLFDNRTLATLESEACGCRCSSQCNGKIGGQSGCQSVCQGVGQNGCHGGGHGSTDCPIYCLLSDIVICHRPPDCHRSSVGSFSQVTNSSWVVPETSGQLDGHWNIGLDPTSSPTSEGHTDSSAQHRPQSVFFSPATVPTTVEPNACKSVVNVSGLSAEYSNSNLSVTTHPESC